MGTGINYLFNKSSLSQAKPLRKQRTQSGMLGKQKSLGDVKFGGGGIPSWSRGSPEPRMESLLHVALGVACSCGWKRAMPPAQMPKEHYLPFPTPFIDRLLLEYFASSPTPIAIRSLSLAH